MIVAVGIWLKATREFVKMKIDELKEGDVVVHCVDIGAKSTYVPPVRRSRFIVKAGSNGISLVDSKGNACVPDFSDGRWYYEKRRDWTPDEMAGLVGKAVSDDSGTHLIAEYDRENGFVSDVSGIRKFGAGEVGLVFGEKYELEPLQEKE